MRWVVVTRPLLRACVSCRLPVEQVRTEASTRPEDTRGWNCLGAWVRMGLSGAPSPVHAGRRTVASRVLDLSEAQVEQLERVAERKTLRQSLV